MKNYVYFSCSLDCKECFVLKRVIHGVVISVGKDNAGTEIIITMKL